MDKPNLPVPTIRRAIAADLPAVGRLGALMVRMHHEFDPQRFIPATSGTERGYASWLGSQLDVANAIVLVAEVESRIVGYTYAGIEGLDYMSLRGPAGVLYDIIVDPDARGRGIGRALLESTMAQLRSRGVGQVVLSTAEQNVVAQRMFERAGFRRTMVEMTMEIGREGTQGGTRDV